MLSARERGGTVTMVKEVVSEGRAPLNVRKYKEKFLFLRFPGTGREGEKFETLLFSCSEREFLCWEKTAVKRALG